MNSQVFCTIVTSDYIPYALALHHSLSKYSSNVYLKVFISNASIKLSDVKSAHRNIEFIDTDALSTIDMANRLRDKYKGQNMDCFRWSMKPVLIKYLLQKGYEQVYYLDSDLHFFSPFEFIYSELAGYSVLLTPHWRVSDPLKDETNFSILQTSGLYNAGFIGVTKKGIPAMDWWAKVCLYKCEIAPEKGLYVDQSYLDSMPVYFERIKILRHKGCNVAYWNQIECKRVLTDGKVKINGEQDVVFIHFTDGTIKAIESGQDALLKPFLNEYQSTLDRYRSWSQSNNNKTSQTKKSDIEDLPLSKIIDDSNDSFLNPSCSPTNLDLFLARNSILNALNRCLSRFSGTLLDVGCGQAPYKALLISDLTKVDSYIGLDLEVNAIHNNSPDITWKDGKIPLPNDSVDCAIGTEVLEHCPDPLLSLMEIIRVLKPGGPFFFTVPFIWPLHESPHDEYRYTPFALTRLLKQAGFVNIELAALGGWDASLAQMLGLWVRRRPLGKRKRDILSRLIFPVYKFLIQTDKSPTQFSDQLMISGVSGICTKP